MTLLDFWQNDTSSGKYDDLIDVGWKTYTRITSVRFWTLLQGTSVTDAGAVDGKEVCVKLYQKRRGDYYQWVSTHVIRVRDKDGDVCHVCINKVR